MLLILDGNSVKEHVRSNLYCLICLRHLIRSRAVKNKIFFFSEWPVFFDACATCIELQFISTILQLSFLSFFSSSNFWNICIYKTLKVVNTGKSIMQVLSLFTTYSLLKRSVYSCSFTPAHYNPLCYAFNYVNPLMHVQRLLWFLYPFLKNIKAMTFSPYCCG